MATKGYKPTVFEKDSKPGGMMRYGIPSYKLEKNVIDAEIDVIRELGVEIRCGIEVGKDVTIADLRKEGYKAFFLAIGRQVGRLPGLENETAINCTTAIDFLHKATENKDTKLDGKVVVIGGGNVAIDAARTAHRFGGKNVEMYCLEDRATMPASKLEIKEAEEENIVINNCYGPKEIRVNSEGAVKEVVFKRCLSTLDESGKFNPKYDEDDIQVVPADYVIFAISQGVNWGNLLEGENLKLNGQNPIADSLTYQTSVPDIFVGGDLFSGPSFVINAIEQGHQAADSLHRFVQPGTSLTIGKNKREFICLNKDDIVVDDYDHAGRQEEDIDETVDSMSFKDARKTLTEEQVRIETSRCLSCGASIVDENKCIGCGLCTTRCEFDAIHLLHPAHWITGFQVLIDAPLLCHLADNRINHFACLLVDFVQIPVEFALHKKCGIQRLVMCFNIFQMQKPVFADLILLRFFEHRIILFTSEFVCDAVFNDILFHNAFPFVFVIVYLEISVWHGWNMSRRPADAFLCSFVMNTRTKNP